MNTILFQMNIRIVMRSLLLLHTPSLTHSLTHSLTLIPSHTFTLSTLHHIIDCIVSYFIFPLSFYSYLFLLFFLFFCFLFSLLGFLGFEKLTHIPIQKKLIDVSLLTDKEINWLNTYHAEVREKVYPLMITDLGRKWLIESTNPLERK